VKIQTLVAVFFILVASLGRAEVPGAYGKKFQLKSFSGAYTSSVQNGSYLYISFIFQASELYGPGVTKVVPVYYAILDKSSGSNLTPWVRLPVGGTHVDGFSDQAFSFDNASKEVAELLPKLKSSVLVLSLNPVAEVYTPTAYIDLTEYCLPAAKKFIDIDNDKMGCP
jgi:hypothetical protein